MERKVEMRIQLRADVLEDHIGRRNLSQNAFARRAGVTSGYISLLLRGRRNPSAKMRQKLLRATRTEDGKVLNFDDLFKMVSMAAQSQPHSKKM
jgi:transcriptional regulator with XRE-family HTH domain